MAKNEIIKKMVLLRRWKGKVLQPSPDADFSIYFSKFYNAKDNFFDLRLDNYFSTIIGVLPSVSYKNITIKNKMHGFDKNTNLYIFYTNKCLYHLERNGELIVYTPSDFFKKDLILNNKIFSMGTITDIIYTEKNGYIIWRFVKDDFSRKTLVNGRWNNFSLTNNQLYFSLAL